MYSVGIMCVWSAGQSEAAGEEQGQPPLCHGQGHCPQQPGCQRDLL